MHVREVSTVPDVQPVVKHLLSISMSAAFCLLDTTLPDSFAPVPAVLTPVYALALEKLAAEVDLVNTLPSANDDTELASQVLENPAYSTCIRISISETSVEFSCDFSGVMHSPLAHEGVASPDNTLGAVCELIIPDNISFSSVDHDIYFETAADNIAPRPRKPDTLDLVRMVRWICLRISCHGVCSHRLAFMKLHWPLTG